MWLLIPHLLMAAKMGFLSSLSWLPKWPYHHHHPHFWLPKWGFSLSPIFGSQNVASHHSCFLAAKMTQASYIPQFGCQIGFLSSPFLTAKLWLPIHIFAIKWASYHPLIFGSQNVASDHSCFLAAKMTQASPCFLAAKMTLANLPDFLLPKWHWLLPVFLLPKWHWLLPVFLLPKWHWLLPVFLLPKWHWLLPVFLLPKWH